MTRVTSAADGSGAIVSQLAASQGTRRAGVAWTMTLLLHGGFAAIALGREQVVEAPTRVTEIEMLPLPPPPPPPSEPKPPASAENHAVAAAPPTAKPRAARPKAAAPAAAAPLRTVEETAPGSDEPVRFVTDPNGTGFGFGTVARGGTGSVQGGEAPPTPVAQAPKHEAPALSRPPQLAEADPCRGYFPHRAQVDRGEVTLKVRVERDGSVPWVTIVREHPTGQGFSFAARDCLRAKRFSPALDREGREVAVVSPVTVRFKR